MRVTCAVKCDDRTTDVGSTDPDTMYQDVSGMYQECISEGVFFTR